MMIRSILPLLLLMANCMPLLAQQPGTALKAGVLRYDIIPANQSTRKTAPVDLLEVDYRMAVASSDSVLTETFTKNQHVTIPANHTSFNQVFKQVKAGDRVTIVILADSFYRHTMRVARPAYIKPGDSLHFFIKVYDVMNEQEFAAKEYNKELVLIKEDSAAFANYIQMYNRVQKTSSGLHYLVSAYGNGKQASAGSKVTIRYKGYTFDGKVFDRNQTGFTFVLGRKEVIDGWEEGVALMKEGARYKLIIPQQLAYGSGGSDLIPPFTSVVFDIELLKVE